MVGRKREEQGVSKTKTNVLSITKEIIEISNS